MRTTPVAWTMRRCAGNSWGRSQHPFFGSASISLHRQEVRRPLLRHSQDQLMK